MGGTEQTTRITKGELFLKLCRDDVMNASSVRMKAVVSKTKSYDGLVGAMALCSMKFILDF